MRYALLFISGIFMASQVSAKTCIGGNIVVGNDETRSFCLSEKTMNWWTAHQWCIGNGRVLATPDSACNYTENWFIGIGGCPNLSRKIGGFAWTALHNGSGGAFMVQNGDTISQSALDARRNALCE